MPRIASRSPIPSTRSVKRSNLEAQSRWDHLCWFQWYMGANDMFNCRVPFCQCSGAPLSSPSIHDEAKTVSNINSHNTYPLYFPSLSAVVATTPPSGGQMDLPFRDAGNPSCIQQPPNHVIDYWFHRLGLSVQTTSAENLSNVPIVGTSSNSPAGVHPFPVLDEINSCVSPEFIGCALFYRCIKYFLKAYS